MNDHRQRCDRDLWLYGAKRNQLLEVWEVQLYGNDSYDDSDYVSIYGMPPAVWRARGARVFGRTAIECTRDRLADALGRDIARIVGASPASRARVVDLFAGSGNTLYWLLRHLPGACGIGSESDTGVFEVTRQNSAALGLSLDIRNTTTWGSAFDPTRELDLRRTAPPVPEVLRFLRRRFPDNRQLCAIQVHETLLPDSAIELRATFDWSSLRIYDLNSPGQNHGILLGTNGPAPTRDRSGED